MRPKLRSKNSTGQYLRSHRNVETQNRTSPHLISPSSLQCSSSSSLSAFRPNSDGYFSDIVNFCPAAIITETAFPLAKEAIERGLSNAKRDGRGFSWNTIEVSATDLTPAKSLYIALASSSNFFFTQTSGKCRWR